MSVLLLQSSYAIILCIFLALYTNAQSVSCPINDPTSGFYRLGQSRFYVKAQPGGFSSNEEAAAFCKSKELRLGSINDVMESVYAGRELETVVYKQRQQLRNNLFYLNAQFDQVRDTYVWKHSDAAIMFQNIYYIAPNEIGGGQSEMFPNRTLCLVFGSPHPVPEDPATKDIYGWSTSMIEWPCKDNVANGNDKRFKLGAFCETVDPECDKMLESSYDLDQISYSGLYPMANRRFVLSWEQMGQEEAEEFCSNYQLTLYAPTEGDSCLLPYIKDHWPDVTTTSFWTSVKYSEKSQMLKYLDGSQKEMKLRSQPKNSDSGEQDTCTTMSYTNERTDHNSKCKCRWNMMVQAVTNCNMPAGVICQHADYTSRQCLVKKDGKLDQEFVTSLMDEKKKFFRSVRKQEHKKAVSRCKELKMDLVTQESDIFLGYFVLDKLVKYDLQTYWVSSPEEIPSLPSVPGAELSASSGSSLGECPVANLEGKESFSEAEFETMKCVEKNFFICEDRNIPSD